MEGGSRGHLKKKQINVWHFYLRYVKFSVALNEYIILPAYQPKLGHPVDCINGKFKEFSNTQRIFSMRKVLSKTLENRSLGIYVIYSEYFW